MQSTIEGDIRAEKSARPSAPKAVLKEKKKGYVNMKSYETDEIYYTEVYDIPINLILPNPNSVRKNTDTLKMNAFVKTIEQYGVIQPITVREAGEYFELISGERRLRGAAAAGLEVVPAIIVDADDNRSAIMSLLENLQREDLCFFEIAEGYKNLIRRQGITQEELARKIGMSRSSIANKMRLLRLSPKVRRLIRDYCLSERHARAILALGDEQTQIDAVKKIHKQHLNAAESEKLVDDILLRNPEKLAGSMRSASSSDMKIFSGTVRRAVEIMKKSGIDAKLETEDHDWGSRFIIDFKKN